MGTQASVVGVAGVVLLVMVVVAALLLRHSRRQPSPANTEFDVERDVTLNAVPDDAGTFAIQTHGLQARGQPELEMAKVPAAYTHEAGVILRATGRYLVNVMDQNRSLKDGETLGMAVGDLWVSLRAHASTLSDGGTRFRLSDYEPDENKQFDAHAFATVKVAQAWEALHGEESNEERALELVNESLSLWPGSDQGWAGQPGDKMNPENVFAYLTRASLTKDPEEGDRDYATALKRSEGLRLTDLGMTHEQLAELDRSEFDAAWELVDRLSSTLTMPTTPGVGPALFTSPIVYLTETGELAALMTMVPWNLKKYAATKLPDTYRSLAYELVKRASTHPVSVLTATRETHWFYEPFNVKPWHKVLAPAGPKAARIVSIVRADLQRRYVAGLSLEDVREIYGLSPKSAANRGRERMVQLRANEEREFVAAVSLEALQPTTAP